MAVVVEAIATNLKEAMVVLRGTNQESQQLNRKRKMKK
jgi:hypothetical protein